MSAAAGVPLDVTGAGWDDEVLGAEGPVLVDFWAPWCAPCKKMEPTLRDVAARYAGRLTVARLDVESQPAVAGRYDVLSLPTLILFRHGEPVERLAGAVKPKRLDAVLAPHLTDNDPED